MLNTTTNVTEVVNVSAEGIYDVEAGSLCMVGCRNLGTNTIKKSLLVTTKFCH